MIDIMNTCRSCGIEKPLSEYQLNIDDNRTVFRRCRNESILGDDIQNPKHRYITRSNIKASADIDRYHAQRACCAPTQVSIAKTLKISSQYQNIN